LQHQPAYTSDIISKLKDADLLVVEGTLYPLLTRMKNGGLLKYEWQESTQGPPRKYYALTDLGVSVLVELNKAWNEISKTVGILKAMT
jgi:PadR family transcriptional regulator PadR